MYEVIGIQHRKYTNKQGREVEGYNLFLSYVSENVSGRACMREWVSTVIMEDSGVSVGDMVDLNYNRFGRICSIKPVG
jgi:hypothetical protein